MDDTPAPSPALLTATDAAAWALVWFRTTVPLGALEPELHDVIAANDAAQIAMTS